MPRRYRALVHGRSAGELEGLVRQRVVIDGRPVEPSDVRVRPGKEGRSILDVTLEEGRNRIVRRWCEEMGLKVERLARFRALALPDRSARRPVVPVPGFY